MTTTPKSSSRTPAWFAEAERLGREIISRSFSFKLTCDHPASSNGVPVLVAPGGVTALGPGEALDVFGLVLSWAIGDRHADREFAVKFLEQDPRWFDLDTETREQLVIP